MDRSTRSGFLGIKTLKRYSIWHTIYYSSILINERDVMWGSTKQIFTQNGDFVIIPQ